MYEVMRERGVRFAFFHEVKDLALSDDGAAIESIEMLEQLAIKGGGDYDPLYDVKGLACWPTAPDWKQIVHGAELEKRGTLIEFERNPLGRKPTTLKRGKDFDEVVLAIPIQVLPEIGAQLIADARNPRLRKAVETAECVMTQGIQTWCSADLRELGWTMDENMLTSTYVEPLDTYCNVSHLIPRESWKPGEVRDIAYFCGVLSHAGLRSQEQAEARVRGNAEEFLERDVGTLWPDFDFDLLVSPNGAKGAKRIDDQFWRANFELTERYVITVPGSVAHRLWPHESGYDNLKLAGDWTHNGIDGGSVEASVTSGMLAAKAICGELTTIRGLDGWLGESDPKRPGDS
jgi:uncharacterized protein with NAD-binding domain and iron-sulfur cluster